MTKQRAVFEVGSTLIVVACALAMVSIQVRSRFQGPVAVEVTQVEDWEAESAKGIWIGPTDAESVVTVFVDFTCPFCRTLAPVLDSLAAIQGDRVALVYHHFSLGRTWSVPSAIAGECADRQGRFREVASLLYDAAAATDAPPDWESVATRGGIPEVSRYLECLELPPDSFPRISMGKEVGRRTGVGGTPTVWINGTPTALRDLEGLIGLVKLR